MMIALAPPAAQMPPSAQEARALLLSASEAVTVAPTTLEAARATGMDAARQAAQAVSILRNLVPDAGDQSIGLAISAAFDGAVLLRNAVVSAKNAGDLSLLQAGFTAAAEQFRFGADQIA